MNFIDPAFFVLKGTITKTLSHSRVVITPIPPGELGGLETERLMEKIESFKQDYKATSSAQDNIKFHIPMRSKNYRQPLTFGLQIKGVEPPNIGTVCECSINLELYDYVSVNPNPKENPKRKGEPIAGISIVCTGWRETQAI